MKRLLFYIAVAALAAAPAVGAPRTKHFANGSPRFLGAPMPAAVGARGAQETFRTSGKVLRRIPFAEYQDRVTGAWLGKNIGVLLGEPIEFKIQWSKPGKPHRITVDGEEVPQAREWIGRVPDGAHDQDDITLNLISLEALEKYGIGVSPAQIAERWLHNRPGVACANAAALNNFRYGILPPLSGHPAFSDRCTDIDAQINVDVWGMVTPGMAGACREYTDRAARMTNYGEGVTAAVFVARMVSEAFFERDVRRVIEAARGSIPAKSEYARMVDDVLRWHRRIPDWRDARQEFARKYEHLGGIHALVNSGAVLIGLLYGEGDFERTLFISMLCGWDCDCNPSTAGGILGAMLGAHALPEKWKAPLKDRYRGGTVRAYAPEIALSELGRRTALIGERIVAARGGRVLGAGPERVLEVPVERPARPTLDSLAPEEIRKAREQVVKDALRDLDGPAPARQSALRRLQRVAQVERALVPAEALERAAALAAGTDADAPEAALLLGEAGDARAPSSLIALAERRLAGSDERAHALTLLGRAAYPPVVADRLLALFLAEPDAASPLAQAALAALAKAPEGVLLRALEHVARQDEKARARLQKTLNALAGAASPAVRERLEPLVGQRFPEWDAGWTVKFLGPDMSPGMRAEYLGRKNVLCTHPLDRGTPAVLAREVDLDAGTRCRLELVVASHAHEGADWLLRVTANGERLGEQVIGSENGEPKWRALTYDLSRFAGQRVRLRLENAANGWSWEAGYWASAKVVEE